VRADERSGANVRLLKAVDRYEQLTGIPLLLRQFAGARIGPGRLRCLKAQKASLCGRTSIPRIQALRGCRSTSR
jgi:hypothetical protein